MAHLSRNPELRKVPKVAGAEYRCTTLAELEVLLEYVRQHCHTWKRFNPDGSVAFEGIPFEEVNLYDVNKNLLTPLGEAMGVCFAELFMDGEPRKPHVFVSHAWGHSLKETVEALRQHAKDRRYAADAPVWICAFAIRQHDVASQIPPKIEASPFYLAVQMAMMTLIIAAVEKPAADLLRASLPTAAPAPLPGLIARFLGMWAWVRARATRLPPRRRSKMDGGLTPPQAHAHMSETDGGLTPALMSALDGGWGSRMWCVLEAYLSLVASPEGYLTDIYSVEDGHVRRLTDGLLQNDDGDDEYVGNKADRDKLFPLVVLMRMLLFALDSARVSEVKDGKNIMAHIGSRGAVVDATVRATFFVAALALLDQLPRELVDVGFVALAASHLRRVVVASIAISAGARLRLVQSLPAAYLQEIKLTGLGLCDADVKALGDRLGTAAPHLRVLDLSNNRIADLSPLAA
eukprot:CAMPEP_0185158396 /NCGR_PEP_ID=MMETSP1139-20130426/2389_1 /TAXON_ID=298111 /ORGANISM="Pavlova sp., Strain CCMP459" /LENGTH=460 /DNA_ID=CAMNT_0027723529 /DNA_START=26 /DNA_END=1404 /DNA_ORIENTATION=+